MKEFEYITPMSLREAIDILARADGKARVLAGGTDLIAQMKEKRKSPELIVDAKRIPELNVLSFDEKQGLKLGGAVSCARVAAFGAVRERYPALAEACGLIGSVQIQNRAAVGGNFCNAAPSADTVPAVLAYGGKVLLAGANDKRELPAEKFFVGPGQTALEQGEILIEINIPAPPPRSSAAYLRFIPREEMDIAVVGVGSYLGLSDDGSRCQAARIALAAVAPTPVRAYDAEKFLVGKAVSAAAFAEAGELAARSANPISDVRGSAAYRIELVKVLTKRSLNSAWQRITGATS